jgi:hypothetical protein
VQSADSRSTSINSLRGLDRTAQSTGTSIEICVAAVITYLRSCQCRNCAEPAPSTDTQTDTQGTAPMAKLALDSPQTFVGFHTGQPPMRAGRPVAAHSRPWATGGRVVVGGACVSGLEVPAADHTRALASSERGAVPVSVGQGTWNMGWPREDHGALLEMPLTRLSSGKRKLGLDTTSLHIVTQPPTHNQHQGMRMQDNNDLLTTCPLKAVACFSRLWRPGHANSCCYYWHGENELNRGQGTPMRQN